MKIVDNSMHKITRFCDLEAGVVFMYEDTLFMKMENVPNFPINFNAVSFVSGVITTIIAITPVRLVDGEFVIKKVNA
jgi:hypothetical protein